MSPAFRTGDESVHGGSLHSRESSVWTAPSPSHTRRSSSPRLPPLRPLPGDGASYPVPDSPSAHQRTDSSLYYTAAWGSPYQLPSGSRGGRTVHGHHWTVSSDLSDGSPLRRSDLTRSQLPALVHFEAQTPVESRRGSNSYRLGSRDRPAATAVVDPGRLDPARGFTEAWVRQYLSGQSNSERGNWWSDESVGSGSDSPTIDSSGDHYGSDLLRFGVESQDGREGLKTPTLSTFVSSRDNARFRSARRGQKGRRHQPKNSTDTVRPADFHTLCADPIAGPKTSRNMLASKFADSPPGQVSKGQPGNASLDKPLPLAPSFERTVSEAPVVNAAPRTPDLSTNDERPSQPSVGSVQRPKKRVIWRGKACIIALPVDGTRGQEDGEMRLLTHSDVKERLRDWETKGYDTRGFGHSNSGNRFYNSESEGQSRSIYPDPGEINREWKMGVYRVSIPDRREWEAYVEFLKEEKLRALGVSFGDDDLSTGKPPVPAAMSRQSSRYPSLPLSPPVPGSSAASNHTIHHTNPFSPAFMPSTNGTSQVGSLASPGSQPAGYGNLHMPSQSRDVPFQYPRHQSTPPGLGIWSPQGYLGSQHAPRGASPALAGTYKNLGSVLGPGPLHGSESKQQNQEQSMSHNTASLNYGHQHLNADQPPHLSKVSDHDEGTEQDMTYRSQPDIVNPIPRGHRHNLSETLQKEIDDAEYHLEESIRHQLEKDEQLNHSQFDSDFQTDQNGSINPEKTTANVFLDPDMNRRGSAQSDGPALASDRNPNHLASHPNTLRESHKSQNQSAHQAKSSMSKLNVEAKEFNFDPKTSFAPGNFSFADNHFAPAHSTSPVSSRPQATNDPSQTRNNLFGAVGSSFNVAAPAFTPAHAASAKFPSGNFNFSSSGPSLRPGAPGFTPGNSNRNLSRTTDSAQSGSEGRVNSTSKIFGNLKLADIVKPSKKSKAIAIIRPDGLTSNNGRDDEGQEDESGRITQADGRQKRLRRGKSDGDQIPQFATPSLPLMEMSQTQSPKRESAKLIEHSVTGKENSEPDQDQDVISPLPPSPPSAVGEKTWEPFEFSRRDEAESFNIARPFSPFVEELTAPATYDDAGHDTKSIHSPSQSDSMSLIEKTIPKESQNPADVEYSETDDSKRPSLSAAAEFFESSGENNSHSFDFGRDLERALPVQAAGGLSDSRFAKSPSPPALPITSTSSRDSDQGNAPMANAHEIQNHVAYPDGEGVNYASLVEPSFHEIDAVMKHLNENDSDLGVERTDEAWPRSEITGNPKSDVAEQFNVTKLMPGVNLRGEAVSPGIKRFQQQYQLSLGESTDIEFQSCQGNFMAYGRPGMAVESPVHRLNNAADVPISDWDDAISSTEDVKLQHRTRFFDNHVDDLVGGLLQQRLEPLEQTLALIQETLTQLTTESTGRTNRRSMSAEVEHSDADDEDDDEEIYQARARSPRKERRLEKMKAAMLETLADQQKLASAAVSSEVMKALSELKKSLSGTRSEVPQGEALKCIVEDALARQLRGRSNPIAQSHEAATAEKYQLQISGLESMLKVAETRADEELRARRAVEDMLADTQRLLRIAEEESARQRESAEETERSLQAFHDERKQESIRTALLGSTQENLQKTAADLAAKNAALEGTLDEYRLSRDQWREDIDDAMAENKDLRRTVDALKTEMEESLRSRQSLRARFDRLQEDMRLAAQEIARDKASSRRREDDLVANNELVSARLQAEIRRREGLELEVVKLEEHEKEAIGLRVAVEHIQRSNQRLEGVVDTLTQENIEHQKAAARLERELIDAREVGQIEVHRIKASMEADVAAANNRVNIVRANLECDITNLRTQLENSKADASTIKARYELMLQEASESRNDALREVAEAREAAMQEHYRFHQRTLEDLKAQHERAMKNSLEDKQRSEINLLERLSLSDAKTEHLLDKVAHLEEKLEIAKSAAHAAAQAAQTARSNSTQLPSRTASITPAVALGLPEKISPQALRESILVLQEQLHERESRLEKLEQELSAIDTEAPTKIKERDAEISWLRELLGVRLDDLGDIISTLSQPEYDRDAVRDAVIRLKANLQMEQQEKERVQAGAGGQTFPSLANITNMASSPRALPLAAAAAWGNWRKNRDPSPSAGNSANGGPGTASRTPSKASRSSTPSFLSGLLTSPATSNIRQPPPGSGPVPLARQASSTARPLRAQSHSARPTSARNKKENETPKPPSTPPLPRKDSYDQNAEGGSVGGIYDDDASMVDGKLEEAGLRFGADEPFGPDIRS